MRTVDSDHGRIDSPVELSLHSIMGAIEKKWSKVIIPSTSCAHLRGKLELTLSSARKRHAKPYWMRMLGCLLSRTAKLGVVLSVGVVKY